MIGERFTDDAIGNSIFLPAADDRYCDNGMLTGARPGAIIEEEDNGDGTFYYPGPYGCYWSSTAHEEYVSDAYFLIFDNDRTFWNNFYRNYGHSVRCVAE